MQVPPKLFASKGAKATPLQVKVKKLLGYIEDGLFVTQAAILAGIGRATLYDWKSKAANEAIPIEQREEYIAFLKAIEEAEAKTERAALAKLRKQEKGWQAQAWFLQRRFGREWWGSEKADKPSAPAGGVSITVVTSKDDEPKDAT